MKHTPFRSLFLLILTILLVNSNQTSIAQDHAAQDGTTVAQSTEIDNTAILDPLQGVVDNRKYYTTFVSRGERLILEPGVMNMDAIEEAIKKAPRFAAQDMPALASPTVDSIYTTMVHSSVVIGTIYDCGRCNNMHGSIAGGVVVSSDGLILTNYHVLDRNDEGVKGLLVMTSTGRCFPVSEILAASSTDDVALIRIECDEKLVPATIARQDPGPLDTIRILSHPHNEFFVMTEGMVSRYVASRKENSGVAWMEVTAEFGAGSSGSGVFNQRGELVGLVSRVHPLIRDNTKKNVSPGKTDGDSEQASKSAPKFAEMVLRRCVPGSEIRECFAAEQ